MSDPTSKTTARTGWQRETFVEHLLHAADEDENAGHSLQAAYIRDAADEIGRLRAEIISMRRTCNAMAQRIDELSGLVKELANAD